MNGTDSFDNWFLSTILGNKYHSIEEFHIAVQKIKDEELEKKANWPVLDFDFFSGILNSKNWKHYQFFQKDQEILQKVVISKHPFPMTIIHFHDFAMDNPDDELLRLRSSISIQGVILYDEQEQDQMDGDEDELINYLPASFLDLKNI